MRTHNGNLGWLASIAVGLAIGGLIGSPMLARKNPTGLLVIAGAAVLTALLYGWITRRRAESESHETRQQRLTLAVAAFFGAPVLAFLAGLLCLAAFDIHPMDRTTTVIQLTVLGGIAGAIIGLALAATSIY